VTLVKERNPQSPDAGQRCRDRELLRYVGRHGVVSIDHVMAAMEVGRTAAYRRVAACIEAGLLERLELLRSEPSLIRTSRAGLRYAGLGFPLAVVSPGAVEHWLRCASTAQLLASEFSPDRLISERELVLLERIEGRPLASARLGELPNGAPRLHRPDLAILTDAGPIAIEVELTPKAPRRLEQIVRAWRRATCVDEVRYYCAPGTTRRVVERAVAKTYSEEKVRVLEAVPR
jgi:hypothetical protein